MNKTLKKRWVKALRSGEYQQGKNVLCRTTRSGNDKFCCLGVLIDVGTSRGEWEKIGYGIWNFTIPPTKGNEDLSDLFQAIDYLPAVLAEKINLPHYQQMVLSEMNDRGATFNEIADWIEENL